MELNAKEDIEAPLDQVYARATDYESIERQVLRRGAELKRLDSLDAQQPTEGMRWRASVSFRGKPREIEVTLASVKPGEELCYRSVSGGLEAETVMQFVELSKARTRVSVETSLVPKTLSARLLVQSLKLGKAGIEKRFRKRMGGLARELEARIKDTA